MQVVAKNHFLHQISMLWKQQFQHVLIEAVFPLTVNLFQSLFRSQRGCMTIYDVVTNEKKEAEPLPIITIRISQVKKNFPAELQNIKKMLVLKHLQVLKGYVVESSAECFKLIGLQQPRVDVLEEPGLRVLWRSSRNKPV